MKTLRSLFVALSLVTVAAPAAFADTYQEPPRVEQLAEQLTEQKTGPCAPSPSKRARGLFLTRHAKEGALSKGEGNRMRGKRGAGKKGNFLQLEVALDKGKMGAYKQGHFERGKFSKGARPGQPHPHPGTAPAD